jgi:glucose-1-phosphate adenylyltransferase
MDYSKMFDFHKRSKADATIAALEVPWDEASRFGIMNTNPDGSIYEFEEKPEQPKSNLASMGIYIFTWDILRDALIRDDKIHRDSDFGKHICPLLLGDGKRMFAYRFKDYWKDVGTIESYWEANMDLINIVPQFNLYDNFYKIYTDSDHQPPMYTAFQSEVKTSVLSEGCEIYGSVYHSVLGTNVIVEEGAIIRDSILMANCRVGKNTIIERCVIDENNTIGDNCLVGHGIDAVNEDKPHIYNTGITVTGENTEIPSNVTIGKNCVICGKTELCDYEGNTLRSGGSIIKEGEVTAV